MSYREITTASEARLKRRLADIGGSIDIHQQMEADMIRKELALRAGCVVQ